MDQILPMEDEESGNELNVINASFADPYLLILREDSSVKIFKATGDGELEDVEATGLSGTSWLSASLFKSTSFTEVFAFLLTPEGGLRVFAMSDIEKPCYVAEALSFLPPVLAMDYVPKRSAIKATITEILAADLGDATTKSPHLIVRLYLDSHLTATDSLVDPHIERQPGSLQGFPFSVTICFRALDSELAMGQAFPTARTKVYRRYWL